MIALLWKQLCQRRLLFAIVSVAEVKPCGSTNSLPDPHMPLAVFPYILGWTPGRTFQAFESGLKIEAGAPHNDFSIIGLQGRGRSSCSNRALTPVRFLLSPLIFHPWYLLKVLYQITHIVPKLGLQASSVHQKSKTTWCLLFESWKIFFKILI